MPTIGIGIGKRDARFGSNRELQGGNSDKVAAIHTVAIQKRHPVPNHKGPFTLTTASRLASAIATAASIFSNAKVPEGKLKISIAKKIDVRNVKPILIMFSSLIEKDVKSKREIYNVSSVVAAISCQVPRGNHITTIIIEASQS